MTKESVGKLLTSIGYWLRLKQKYISGYHKEHEQTKEMVWVPGRWTDSDNEHLISGSAMSDVHAKLTKNWDREIIYKLQTEFAVYFVYTSKANHLKFFCVRADVMTPDYVLGSTISILSPVTFDKAIEFIKQWSSEDVDRIQRMTILEEYDSSEYTALKLLGGK